MTESDPKASKAPNPDAPYELAPVEDVPVARPAPTKDPKGKLEAPGLIADFDEDADFSQDPEVEATLKGKKLDKNAPKSKFSMSLPGVPGVDSVPLVRDGRLDVKWGAILGWGLVLGGGIAAAITTKNAWFAGLLATILACVLHTITGLGAVGIAGYFLERPIGRVDLAATRVLAAVGAFALCFHIDTTVLGHFDETALACAAYLAVMLIFFRVHGAEVMLIGVAHAALWAFVAAANWVSNWAHVPTSPLSGP